MKIFLGSFKQGAQILIVSRKIFLIKCQTKVKGGSDERFPQEFMSQEFKWTGSCNLGVPSRLGELFQNLQPRAFSRVVPETSQKLGRGNQGTNEDGSQHNRLPEVGVSPSPSPQDCSLEETFYNGQLLERFTQYTERKHDIDFGPLTKRGMVTGTEWNTKDKKKQQNFMSASGPE